MNLPRWWGNACTGVPDLDIGHICLVHDAMWANANTLADKRRSDRLMMDAIIEHGRSKRQPIRYWLLGVIYFLGLQTFGMAYWGLSQ